jgi:hypothetical protein
MLQRTITVTAVAAVAAAALAAAPALAGRPGRWELLGTRSVSDKADHDTIVVTRAQGTFRALQLKVEGRPVQFRQMTVHFANGASQDVELRDVIRAGGRSRVIDIAGAGDRVVRSVELRYDAQSLAGRSATVKLFGKN